MSQKYGKSAIFHFVLFVQLHPFYQISSSAPNILQENDKIVNLKPDVSASSEKPKEDFSLFWHLLLFCIFIFIFINSNNASGFMT